MTTPTAAANTNANPYVVAYGAKYDKALDVAEIAKRVRADLKALVASGELPAAKYAVTISRYAGGRSLRVRIEGLPFAVANEERVKADVLQASANGWTDQAAPLLLHTEAARAVRAKVEAVVEAYNFDGSHSQSDHFHVNFYGDVDFGEQEGREWKALRAKYEAERVAAVAANRARRECSGAMYHDAGRGCGLCE